MGSSVGCPCCSRAIGGPLVCRQAAKNLLLGDEGRPVFGSPGLAIPGGHAAGDPPPGTRRGRNRPRSGRGGVSAAGRPRWRRRRRACRSATSGAPAPASAERSRARGCESAAAGRGRQSSTTGTVSGVKGFSTMIIGIGRSFFQNRISRHCAVKVGSPGVSRGDSRGGGHFGRRRRSTTSRWRRHLTDGSRAHPPCRRSSREPKRACRARGQTPSPASRDGRHRPSQTGLPRRSGRGHSARPPRA